MSWFNSSLDGCSFEQDGEDFYIVGADSVRKKLGSGNLKIIKSGALWKNGEYVNINLGATYKHIYLVVTNSNTPTGFTLLCNHVSNTVELIFCEYMGNGISNVSLSIRQTCYAFFIIE